MSFHQALHKSPLWIIMFFLCPLSPELEIVLHPVQSYSDGSHCWKPTLRVGSQSLVLRREGGDTLQPSRAPFLD